MLFFLLSIFSIKRLFRYCRTSTNYIEAYIPLYSLLGMNEFNTVVFDSTLYNSFNSIGEGRPYYYDNINIKPSDTFINAVHKVEGCRRKTSKYKTLFPEKFDLKTVIGIWSQQPRIFKQLCNIRTYREYKKLSLTIRVDCEREPREDEESFSASEESDGDSAKGSDIVEGNNTIMMINIRLDNFNDEIILFISKMDLVLGDSVSGCLIN